MCGIVGYIGKKQKAVDVVMAGLQGLEYRGYDSAGIAFLDGKNILVDKQVGRVQSLRESLGDGVKSSLAIGHTRWATHGAPSILNAHPHFNTDKTIMTVHNGIIENHTELREHLEKQGYTFVSQTDTEVIPHLIDFYLRTSKDFTEAFKETLDQLRGAYAVAVVTSFEPDVLYAAQLSSPLVLGVGDKECIIASDASAILEHTKKVVYLDDYEFVRAKSDGSYYVHDFKNAREVKHAVEELDYDAAAASKGDYEHYMLKEIYEAPQTIRSAILGRIKLESNTLMLGGLEGVADLLI